jgi:uncharacterized OB-fold protein
MIEAELPTGKAASVEAGEDHSALPLADSLTAPYWKLGETGLLHLLRCMSCGAYNHPPKPCCRECQSLQLEWRPVHEGFEIYSFGVSKRPWGGRSGTWVPAVVAVVGQPTVRVFAEVADCETEDLRIGLPLEVRFRRVTKRDEVIYLPVFVPGEVESAAT